MVYRKLVEIATTGQSKTAIKNKIQCPPLSSVSLESFVEAFTGCFQSQKHFYMIKGYCHIKSWIASILFKGKRNAEDRHLFHSVRAISTTAVGFWLLWPLDGLSLCQLAVPNPIVGYHLAVLNLKYSSQSSG